ncbi:MAG: DNA replication and repair protein RecF, partial [Victivallaceae bacterium]|nr:DNA replication and repair protein RecF [Victivallaceae bacterium]
MLRKLTLRNWRNHRDFTGEFDADTVVFCGPNGAGKTNLLEAIHFLSVLRSFRTPRLEELRGDAGGSFFVGGLLEERNSQTTLSVEISGSTRKLFINQEAVRRASDFIHEFQTVVFAPEDRAIVTGASGARRRFFDIFCSHASGEYLAALQRYHAANLQRNAVLKRGATPATRAMARAFSAVLAECAPVIERHRAAAAELLSRETAKIAQEAGLKEFGIEYRYDYPLEPEEFQARLAKEQNRDFQRGFGGTGPHLDEFHFHYADRLLRHYGSTGETRLISLFLKLAELSLSCRREQLPVLALVDDVTGELDAANKERFLAALGIAKMRFFT